MQTQSSRIYAFDYLKTAMMILVVVCHAALTYIVTDLDIIWPFKDPNGTSILFDGLIAFISFNSMPVFFVISGFMTASLVAEQGVRKMIKNRLHRIFYPFVVFLLILFPIMGIAYFNLKFTISNIPDPFLSALDQVYKDQFEWREFRPIHLWFLYYLLLFCLGGGILATLFGRKISGAAHKIDSVYSSVYFMKTAPLILATITFILIYLRRQNIIEIPGAFSINFLVFLNYALFFGFGWILYYQKKYLTRFSKGYLYLNVIGFGSFFVKLVILSNNKWVELDSMQVILAAIHAVMVWYLIFGFIGLALRYFNFYWPLGQYLSAASYWIYLIHFPIVFFLQAALIHVDFNVYIKFLLVVTLTFSITILSYHFLVRNKLIGRFLNGPKKIKQIV